MVFEFYLEPVYNNSFRKYFRKNMKSSNYIQPLQGKYKSYIKYVQKKKTNNYNIRYTWRISNDTHLFVSSEINVIPNTTSTGLLKLDDKIEEYRDFH